MEIEKEHNNVDIMQLAIAVGSLYGWKEELLP
jgi:hypothetical protein